MNKFEEAISHGEADQFFLGIGKYYVHNRDWDEHDITATQEDLREYAGLYGEIQLYEKLNFELEKMFANNIIPTKGVLNILSFIWWQNINRLEEKKLNAVWTVSPAIKEGIFRYINHPGIDPDDKKRITDLLDRMEKRFGFELAV